MTLNPISGMTSGFAAYGMGSGFNLPGAFPLAGPSASEGTTEATSALAAGGDFGSVLASKLTELNQLHQTSDELSVKALTGDLTDIHEYTIAANQAQTATQLAVNVRNKAVEAFTEIMRMPL